MSARRHGPGNLRVTAESVGAGVRAGRAGDIESGQDDAHFAVVSDERADRVDQSEPALDGAIEPADPSEIGGDRVAGAGCERSS